MLIVIMLAALAGLGGFIGYLRGKRKDDGKHVVVYAIAGAGIALAVGIGLFFALIAFVLMHLPVC